MAAVLAAGGALLLRGELEPWVQHVPAGAAIGALFRTVSMPGGAGEIAVPADLPPGKYTVTVTAEDIAHNVGAQEVSLEIW
jgi:hypothetical protein